VWSFTGKVLVKLGTTWSVSLQQGHIYAFLTYTHDICDDSQTLTLLQLKAQQ